MAKSFQAVRGMNDCLPAQTPLWANLESVLRQLLSGYGYQEMRIPLVESTELFKRSIGEVTDIVEKEMYTFLDRNGESLTLRPEATAGFVRACIEHGLLHNQTQRIWCIGPMFRYEKPQKGRYRQFHQLDVEAFGLDGPDIDAELICLSARLWQQLGLNDVTLQLNSLGSSTARKAYRAQLVDYFQRYHNDLDEDSQRRLHSNPLRILDSKNTAMAEIIAAAPKLLDHLDTESLTHFEHLQALLQAANIPFTLNSRLVRGLDYYNRTVFEWVTDRLGAQNTVCGGGRYDGLVEHLGGRPTPGIGFAIGLERLAAMLAEHPELNAEQPLDAYLMAIGSAAQIYALGLAERLRGQLPQLRLQLHCGGGSLKSQFKRADRSNARYALVIGDQELADNTITVKALREDSAQQALNESALYEFLRTHSSLTS